MVDGIAKSDSSTPEQRLDELEVVLERLKCLTNEVSNGTKKKNLHKNISID